MIAALVTFAGGVLVAFALGVLAVFTVAVFDYLRGLQLGYAPVALACVAVGAGGTTALMFTLAWLATAVAA
jgi:hypothetical protein